MVTSTNSSSIRKYATRFALPPPESFSLIRKLDGGCPMCDEWRLIPCTQRRDGVRRVVLGGYIASLFPLGHFEASYSIIVIVGRGWDSDKSQRTRILHVQCATRAYRVYDWTRLWPRCIRTWSDHSDSGNGKKIYTAR